MISIIGEFINANIGGSSLVFVIVLLRILFLNKIPIKMFMIFWEIALLRFICLFKFNFLYFNDISLPTVFYSTEKQKSSLTFIKQNNNIYFINLIFCVWFIVMSLLLLSVVYTHLKNRKHYNEAIPAYSILVKQILEENKLSQKIQVKKLDTISSPFVYGFVRQTIIFPLNMNLDCEATKYILTHEIAHIKNKDIWKKIILTIVVSLYWFNPFAWIMFILMNRDMELICDEAVLKKYGSSHNHIYANLLLLLEEYKVGLLPYYVGIGKNSIKERIEVIMKITKKSIFCIVISVIIIVISSCYIYGTNIRSRAQSVKDDNATFSKEELELNEKINQAINESTKESFSIYEKFGLSYDSKTDQLYLNEQPIRYFEDNIADDGIFVGNQYHCENGTDGAYVVYNQNKEIQSIKKFTDKELEEHLKKSWK